MWHDIIMMYRYKRGFTHPTTEEVPVDKLPLEEEGEGDSCIILWRTD